MDKVNFENWTKATGDLPWGAQRVLKETLEAVAQNDVKLVYGTDYRDGFPCLINAAATMLGAIKGEGGRGKPSAYFGEVVSQFDRINTLLQEHGVNKGDSFVSPLAAEILLANFAPLKEPVNDVPDQPMPDNEAFENQYDSSVELSDEELMESWVNAMQLPPLKDDEVNRGSASRNGEAEVSEQSAEATAKVHKHNN